MAGSETYTYNFKRLFPKQNVNSSLRWLTYGISGKGRRWKSVFSLMKNPIASFKKVVRVVLQRTRGR
jgi:hypothetical protein